MKWLSSFFFFFATKLIVGSLSHSFSLSLTLYLSLSLTRSSSLTLSLSLPLALTRSLLLSLSLSCSLCHLLSLTLSLSHIISLLLSLSLSSFDPFLMSSKKFPSIKKYFEIRLRDGKKVLPCKFWNVSVTENIFVRSKVPISKLDVDIGVMLAHYVPRWR